jgi:hypothetical protein
MAALASSAFSREDLGRLPFVRHVPDDGRRLILDSFFDHTSQSWHLYLPYRDQLVQVAGGESVVGAYMAEQTANAKVDLEFQLGTLVIQHLAFPKVARQLPDLIHGFHSLACCLEKFDIAWNRSRVNRMEGSVLAAAELSHLIIEVRSIYDAFQRLIAAIAMLLHSQETPARRIVKNLRSSFADIVGRALPGPSADKLRTKFGLPLPLAEFYAQQSEHFLKLRSMRDDIVHRGGNNQVIYCLEDGFAVPSNSLPWSTLPIWTDANVGPNNLGSLRSVLRFLVGQVLDAQADLAGAIQRSATLPRSINPNLKSFIRHPFSARLIDVTQLRFAPWENAP